MWFPLKFNWTTSFLFQQLLIKRKFRSLSFCQLFPWLICYYFQNAMALSQMLGEGSGGRGLSPYLVCRNNDLSWSSYSWNQCRLSWSKDSDCTSIRIIFKLTHFPIKNQALSLQEMEGKFTQVSRSMIVCPGFSIIYEATVSIGTPPCTGYQFI